MSDFLANVSTMTCFLLVSRIYDIEYGFLNVVPLWAFGLNY